MSGGRKAAAVADVLVSADATAAEQGLVLDEAETRLEVTFPVGRIYEGVMYGPGTILISPEVWAGMEAEDAREATAGPASD